MTTRTNSRVLRDLLKLIATVDPNLEGPRASLLAPAPALPAPAPNPSTAPAPTGPGPASTEPETPVPPTPIQLHETGSTGDFSANRSTGPQSPIRDPKSPIRLHADTPTRCHAITRAGAPCRAQPRAGASQCPAHDPAYRDEFMRHSRLGGATSAQRQRKLRVVKSFAFNEVALTERRTIQLCIDALFRLELTGQLPRRRAANLLRFLSLAIRNIDDPASAVSDQAACALIPALNRELALALDTAGSHDAAAEAHAISLQSYSRGQKAQDLDRWPSLDTRPVAAIRRDYLK
jgi:hypothetical protein